MVMRHEKNRIKVAVGLSGGMDSSVTAALLKQKGYTVIPITMEIFDRDMDRQPSEKPAGLLIFRRLCSVDNLGMKTIITIFISANSP